MKQIIDVCCGSKMFWFDKNNENVIFSDKRKEKHILCDGRLLEITPDIILDFTNIPFQDNTFKLVIFDPPHLEKLGKNSWMAKKYGILSSSWKEDIKKGFSECFRILENNGILIFKWNETQIKSKEILSLTDIRPLIGHKTGHKNFTHWYIFMKNEND